MDNPRKGKLYEAMCADLAAALREKENTIEQLRVKVLSVFDLDETLLPEDVRERVKRAISSLIDSSVKDFAERLEAELIRVIKGALGGEERGNDEGDEKEDGEEDRPTD